MKSNSRGLTDVQLALVLQKLINNIDNVGTLNSKKYHKMSYSVANRREPDNFNKKGVARPRKPNTDMHIFIDTSMSITKKHYMDSCMTVITLAKCLNIDVYVSSFTHVLGPEHKLNVMNKSIDELQSELLNIRKESGGTNLANVWDYAVYNSNCKNRISIMITDFDWVPKKDVKISIPHNMYYVPCANIDDKILNKNLNRLFESHNINADMIKNRLLY